MCHTLHTHACVLLLVPTNIHRCSSTRKKNSRICKLFPFILFFFRICFCFFSLTYIIIIIRIFIDVFSNALELCNRHTKKEAHTHSMNEQYKIGTEVYTHTHSLKVEFSLFLTKQQREQKCKSGTSCRKKEGDNKTISKILYLESTEKIGAGNANKIKIIIWKTVTHKAR